ncbi:hypothetical protein FO519_004259 [Halicephalobus sp. NKZ332]|nr:hypothetical protein FO519_004259 [Halicephalobus sp. NKZ332]
MRDEIPTKSAVSCSLINKGLILGLSVVSIVGLSTAPQFFGVGICMFVSIFTLIVTSLNVGIVASDWQQGFADISIFQNIFAGERTKWHHLQYAFSIMMVTFNFISFVLLSAMAQMVVLGGKYFLPGVCTLVITVFFLFEAAIALKVDPDGSTFGDDYEQISES